MNEETSRSSEVLPDGAGESWKPWVAVGLGTLLAGTVGLNYILGQAERQSSQTVEAASGRTRQVGLASAGSAEKPPEALPQHRRDPFSPLPKRVVASVTSVAPTPSGAPSGTGPSGPPPVVPPAGAGPVQSSPSRGPIAASVPGAPAAAAVPEDGMTPTMLMGTAMGGQAVALFQYGAEVLERKQGEYLGVYRILAVDHGKVGLVDSRHNQVWLFSGQTVGGTPAAGRGATGTTAPSGAAPQPAPAPQSEKPAVPAVPRTGPPTVISGPRLSEAISGADGPLPLVRRMLVSLR